MNEAREKKDRDPASSSALWLEKLLDRFDGMGRPRKGASLEVATLWTASWGAVDFRIGPEVVCGSHIWIVLMR